MRLWSMDLGCSWERQHENARLGFTYAYQNQHAKHMDEAQGPTRLAASHPSSSPVSSPYLSFNLSPDELHGLICIGSESMMTASYLERHFRDILETLLDLWASITGREALECHAGEDASFLGVHLKNNEPNLSHATSHRSDPGDATVMEPDERSVENRGPHTTSFSARTASLCAQISGPAVNHTQRIGTAC